MGWSVKRLQTAVKGSNRGLLRISCLFKTSAGFCRPSTVHRCLALDGTQRVSHGLPAARTGSEHYDKVIIQAPGRERCPATTVALFLISRCWCLCIPVHRKSEQFQPLAWDLEVWCRTRFCLLRCTSAGKSYTLAPCKHRSSVYFIHLHKVQYVQ